ncbi:MAG: hypothetical protein JKY65_29515 [Planctomycetes bacterium]|nr:hypothetical protein [Planctomycetota bacterium]
MNESDLAALRAKWHETESDEVRSEYLRAWAEAGCAPISDPLLVAARFGSDAAAHALGLEVSNAPQVLSLPAADSIRFAFGAWEAGYIYFLALARFVRAFWIQRGQSTADAMGEVQPLLEASQLWFDSRSEADSGKTLVWARAAWAQGELLEGRLQGQEDHPRGVRHLVLSLGHLGYVGAPRGEPFSRDRPERHDKGLSDDELRFARVVSAHFQVREAVKGVMYAEQPGLNTKIGAFRKDIVAAAERFEARAAGALCRWILAGALQPR